MNETVDRRALVDRHRVRIGRILPDAPLSVGNGELGFTVDVTGLQSLPDRYPVVPRDPSTGPGSLLGTQAQWGWHATPPDGSYRLEDSLVEYATARGRVPYVDMGGSISGGTERDVPARDRWLRANPHRLDLGRIGFVEGPAGEPLRAERLTGIDQRLDLWRAELVSDFNYAGRPVRVRTVCHPERDILAIRIEAWPGALAVRIAFAYGSEAWHDGTDWGHPERHTTRCERTREGWLLDRRLDASHYQVRIAAAGAQLRGAAPHIYLLGLDSPVTDVVVGFDRLPAARPLPDLDAVRGACHDHWAGFWTSGGAVAFDEVADDRAAELERRTVLSQYLTKINCAGSLPPQETGLVCNSWRGKFHLEMHWWHAAQFALWGRPELLMPSLRWYADVLPVARATARQQGCGGARWPKQVGPGARESPSSIGPFLVWQQPHPIHLAELAYRAQPDDSKRERVLADLADIVFATAEFMADHAERTASGFELGPPLVPAQESFAALRQRVRNPTFELVYWVWALRVASRWRDRLGLPAPDRWTTVADAMVHPTARDGVYPAIGVEPYTLRTDHPSMLCALGFLPQTDRVDPQVMAATLNEVLADWDWPSTWGWDYPVIALCAARLGRPEQAVDALLMDTAKNHVLANGHYRQTDSLPLYLPGNGGLLAAVAVMAAGWDHGPRRPVPGFPANWPVRAEGLIRAP